MGKDPPVDRFQVRDCYPNRLAVDREESLRSQVATKPQHHAIENRRDGIVSRHRPRLSWVDRVTPAQQATTSWKGKSAGFPAES